MPIWCTREYEFDLSEGCYEVSATFESYGEGVRVRMLAAWDADTSLVVEDRELLRRLGREVETVVDLDDYEFHTILDELSSCAAEEAAEARLELSREERWFDK